MPFQLLGRIAQPGGALIRGAFQEPRHHPTHGRIGAARYQAGSTAQDKQWQTDVSQAAPLTGEHFSAFPTGVSPVRHRPTVVARC